MNTLNHICAIRSFARQRGGFFFTICDLAIYVASFTNIAISCSGTVNVIMGLFVESSCFDKDIERNSYIYEECREQERERECVCVCVCVRVCVWVCMGVYVCGI